MAKAAGMDAENGAEELCKDDDGRPLRTGTMWTAAAHILTAVIGAGVLSLPWSISRLGWAAGSVMMLVFAFVTYYASLLQAECYRSPDGKRNYTYMSAVRSHLGSTEVLLCTLAQYSQLFGVTVSYVITSSSSMGLIRSAFCVDRRGGACSVSFKAYMAIFGCLQLMFAHLPDIASLWWLSIVATVTSFFYCLTALGLSIAKAWGHHHARGTAAGVVTSKSNKAFQGFQALGNIAFAYAFSIVLIEIQDTIKSSPPENVTMKKATLVGTVITTAFYMSVACAGYMAFGNDAPGNLLAGFQRPLWLIVLANVSLVVHLTGSYQLCSQAIFVAVENWAEGRWGSSRFLAMELTLRVPFTGWSSKLRLWKLVWRSSYVLLTVFVALLIPFFNDVVGLIGAFGFWPLTVYFPVKMYLKQGKAKVATPQWFLLEAISLLSFLISVVAAIGSVQGIIQDLRHYSPFGG